MATDAASTAVHPSSSPPGRGASGEVLAGPAVGLTATQMTYATGRGTLSHPPTATLHSSVAAPSTKPVAQEPLPAANPSAWQPSTPDSGTRISQRVPTTPLNPPAEDDGALEQLPPPPQPPVVLPSSAAAVRVKEQLLQPSLAVRPGYAGARPAEEPEEDEIPVGTREQEQPGVLARVADAASSAAASVASMTAAAASAAVPAAKSVVAQGAELAAAGFGAAAQTAEAVAEAAEPDEYEAEQGQEGEVEQAPSGMKQQEHAGMQRTAPACGTISLASAPSPAAARAAAATTAAVLPASAARPAATGRGYFPTVGEGAPTAKPAPRPSGELEARHVVAEHLSGLAAQAAVPAGPSNSPGHRARGKRTSGRPEMDEDWISELVERLWPYTKAAVEQMAWEMLPDILEASEPSWIHNINLKKFELGHKEPDLSNIRVFMDDNDVMEDCCLEFDVEWRSQQDIELEIQVLPGNMDKAWIPNFIENKLKDMLTFSVGVEDARLKGRVRLTLRPLLRRVPLVGAVQVSLLEPPDFDFDLTLGSSTNVPMEPALKSWLKGTLQDAVFKSYVLPEHYFLQIDPDAQDIECPTGVLVVDVVEARKVPKMDLLTRSSPFVELYVRTSQRRVTSTKNNTKRPKWRERVELPVHVPEHQELTLILYDYDWASANDEIGRATIKVADLPPGQTQDLWVDVTGQGEEELAAAKQGMRKRDKAKIAAAKPVLKQSTKGCQLHLQITYLAFSDAEEKLVAEGRQKGMRAMLDSPQGRQINPHLRNLLLSGMVAVRVPRADDLPVSSLIGRPSVSGVVRGGGEEKEFPAVKASRHGSVAFDQPVEIHLDADVTQSPSAAVTVELRQGGWFGGGEVGSVKLPVQDLIQRGHIQEMFRLDGTSTGRVELDVQWKPYF